LVVAEFDGALCGVGSAWQGGLITATPKAEPLLVRFA
jgi:hypothetical protein